MLAQKQQIQLIAGPIAADALETAGAVLQGVRVNWDDTLAQRLPGSVQIGNRIVHAVLLTCYGLLRLTPATTAAWWRRILGPCTDKGKQQQDAKPQPCRATAMWSDSYVERQLCRATAKQNAQQVQ